MIENPINKKGCDARQNSHSPKTIFDNNLYTHFNENKLKIQVHKDSIFICFVYKDLFLTRTNNTEPSFKTWRYLGEEQFKHPQHFTNICETAKFLDHSGLVVNIASAYILLNQGELYVERK